MQNTPRGLRRHIALFGRTNAGKSTLFNLLTGQENAIVSEKAGTTTDPVIKNMELLPFGAVTLIDTAGLSDKTALGEQRKKKTMKIARRADLGLFVHEVAEAEINNFDDSFFSGAKLRVFTKCDLINSDVLKSLKQKYKDAIFVSKNNSDDIDFLKNAIIKRLTELEQEEESGGNTLIGGLVPQGSVVLMIVPIDGAAPKGRLILPQVQLIRDCLDHGLKAFVTKETELESALRDIPEIALAVTDSQAFDYVNKVIPAKIPLTSFSILLARQKGDLSAFVCGAKAIQTLKQDDNILMLEACTHNTTHEDIGRVKIPALINRFTRKNFRYDFFSGYDMPDNLEKYSMAILCGSCMINRREVLSRLTLLGEKNIPVTNYGVILAHLNGILDRCTEKLT